ncbi:cell division protein FtsW [Sporosarcina sp. P37]|uniref:FtsW/RodA/SpoVE family cell cycle protein n=1 Tax=unclassified Sporosarcina TaxID=2647733 RepID=UPI0009BEB501|nr:MULTISPECIES: putative peptidoglycan glycosyltransferase FtsW [unclassified Sporosarcina]ARD49174.1 cell division protein FtsW [Sporosarcina sp. P33]ARK25651.1 cell division protein FtsW [Sporosarcina sp. P37]PID18052.1 cell division protein FtsW [Sporosarcina sp. P35]
MKTYMNRILRNFDYPLFAVYMLLCVFGLIMIYSASMVWSMNIYNFEPSHFFKKQIKSLAIAIPAFLVVSIIPYRHYRSKKFLYTALGIMFTLLVLVKFIGFGDAVGAKSWLSLPFGLGNLQPTEVAKIAFIVYFSGVFANKYYAGTLDEIKTTIFPTFSILTASLLLVLLEPDFGATMILFLVAISVIMASGMKVKNYLIISRFFALLGVLIGIVLWIKWDTVMTVSRMGRFLAFTDPFEYIQGSGLQIVNGYIAIGAGGLKGVGLGNSIQKLGYLPEPHTDVIMAVISEETGIFGTTLVLGGLFFIVMRAFTVALRTKDAHARMLAAGVGSLIAIQTLVNLGGLTGLIPLTGVTLPFISYGGTSVVFLSIALGILMNVSMFVKYEKTK